MRIVIDLQGAQTASRFRGIGRYSLSLAQAIVRNRGEHEVLLALNGMLVDTIEPLRAAFDGLLPQANIRVWQAPGPVRELDPANTWRRQAAELLREAFLASLKPDVVHVSSLFEGYEDDAVTSIGRFTEAFPTAVTLYDLIPLANPDEPLKANALYTDYYQRKITHLKRAQRLLAISESSRLEALSALHFPADMVVNISSATDFSWDANARRAIDVFEQLHTQQAHRTAPAVCRPQRRPRLACVSPLPPERTGIAAYSAELLPELARYYDIEVITPQTEVTDPWVRANCPVHSVDWFRANARRYDRVMYHFGNSPFHSHMFDLLPEVPGVVVLHDFFLGDVQWHDEAHGVRPNAWVRELQHAHGYITVQERFHAADMTDVVRKYPCNLSVLQHAQGIIVHSQVSRELAKQWYGSNGARDWQIIPHLRTPVRLTDASAAKHTTRRELGVPDDAFLVCSFGMLGPSKANHRLLNAWMASPLAQNPRCYLVFVGENHGGHYGAELLAAIRKSGLSSRISITGWASEAVFRQYLFAADMAVQLRAQSRGETSGTVLDCMNHALPTIVNAHGSMAELLPDAVWMLPDVFTDEQLVEALSTLYADAERRHAISSQAHQTVRQHHAPSICAARYGEAIERFHAQAQTGLQALIRTVARLDNVSQDEASWANLAHCLAQNHPLPNQRRQLLVDVSAIACHDLKTGIQRVARSILLEFINNPPSGCRVEPVYVSDASGSWQYRYARKYAARLLNCPDQALEDSVVEFQSTDILFCLDLTGSLLVETERSGLFQQIKNTGTKRYFTVFDLLPVLRPEFFPPGTDREFGRWLSAVGRVADGVVAISQSVAEQFFAWSKTAGPARPRPIDITWFHLGADLAASAPTRGLDAYAEQTLTCLRRKPSFLMVGTIEPRKGHLQTLAAFEDLWAGGIDANLVIVGKEGWKGLPESSRRTIPEIVSKLRHHPELGRRLFWLEGISDEYLEQAYAASTCLIAASEDEGFGLPLVEAAQHKLPIIARDIPVFREVAGEYAFYFSGQAPDDLAMAVRNWLGLHAQGKAPSSENMPWLTWRQSAQQLLAAILPATDLLENKE